jgi:Bacterial TSP3 repeat
MARMLVESDIQSTLTNSPAELPRTRYEIVLITDGSPTPRCTWADGAGNAASAQNPMGTWADTDPTYCNTVDPQDPDYIPGFIPGGDRNQNHQLFAPIDALKGVAATARVGKMELHTLLATNAEAIAQCGALCTDLYPPDPSLTDRVEAARRSSAWLLGELSHRLKGSFRGFENYAGLDALATARVDGTTLFSPMILRGLYVQPVSAVRTAAGWEPDFDGDGLSDAVESAAGSATRPDAGDTDGDGFDDLYESTHGLLGFDPAAPDIRGCDPTRPLTPGCRAIDSDGDGLSQFAERWNLSREVFADSDSDGIPDGLELRAGLDPASPNFTDLDGDALLDSAEVRQGTDPLVATPADDADALQVSWTLTSQSPGERCYDLTLDNLPLEAPAGQPAYFKIWLGEAPSAAPSDYGVWKAACARALRTDAAQSPADLVLPGLSAANFRAADELNQFRLTPNMCLTPTDFPSP